MSCCLLDGADVVSRCVSAGIKPRSFYDPKHGIVYERVVDLHNRQKPIDVSVVAEELKTARQLDTIGGYAFLAQVSSRIPTTAQASYFIEKVREQALLREIILSATSAVEACYGFSGGIDEFVAGYKDRAVSIHDHFSAGSTKPRGFTVWGLPELAAHVPEPNSAIMGEPGGAEYWHDRDLALLLGPSGVGKSRLNLQLAVSQILGWDFVGFRLFGPPRKWLLMGNENSVDRYKRDLESMLRNATAQQRELLAGYLRFQALVDDSSDLMALDDARSLSLWRATAAAHKPEIVSVDPWEAVIIGGDCNDSAATRESVRMLRGIFAPHNPRFTPLIVHHAREGAEAARKAEGFDAGAFAKGSKTLRTMARFGINVAPFDPEDGGRVVIACGKINNARRFNTRGAVMDESTSTYSLDPDFDVVAWRDDVEGKYGKSCSVRDVVEAVRCGSKKTADIVHRVHEETAACTRTIKTRLREAVELGYLNAAERGFYALGARRL